MKRATPEFAPQGPPNTEALFQEGNGRMSLQQNSLNRNLPDSFDSDRLVSPEVAAELMGLSLATLRRMWSDGEGPRKIRISKRRIDVRLRDLAEYLDRAAV
jgi:predicted DNA-binding transcriptional regulator AlpA